MSAKISLLSLLLMISVWHSVYSNHPNIVISPMLDSSMNLTKMLGGDDINRCFHQTTNQTNNDSLTNIDNVSRIMLDGAKFFAIRLFKTLNLFEPKQTSNGLIFSPASIWSTMIIAYLGSEGETEQELSNRLKLNQLSKSSVALAYRSIKWWKQMKTMQANSNKTNGSDSTLVSSANKLYIDNQIQLNNCFEQIFHDEIELKPFSTRPEQCVQEINGWVNDQTKGKINDLIVPGTITPMTKIMMVNAIYFKSFWAQQFDSSRTERQLFHVSNQEHLECNMMRLDSASVMFGLSDQLAVTAIELPYSNPDYSMVILLPDPSRSLDSLIRDLSLSKLQQLFDQMYDDEVMVMIPKFQAEQEFELAGALFSMGIKKLFDPRYANLALIFADNNGNHSNQSSTLSPNKIALDSVVHKSFIAVNEEGTEAAAATAMIFARSGRPAFPTEFIANRPFLYMIRDISTNMILFLGTVRRPSSPPPSSS
uniref:Serpin B6-like n=1 Tax=Dermatophagoides pteronyssinus TaxID=6956 RepID=A0A6P6Y8B1_DERPT|nr:serpin B6-like [Dermatophagoides pteronyssinus]